MLNRNAQKIDRIVLESLRQTNDRCMILSGWGTPTKWLSKEILYLDAVPHQWLSPRCKMIIHHGGAGTTAAGLRAGFPNIVIPFMGDQHFWGMKVYLLGVGPKPISINKLSVETLTRAMIESDKDKVHKSAQFISQELKSEDGVNVSVKFIERYSDGFQDMKR